jgi:hypothetical protein
MGGASRNMHRKIFGEMIGGIIIGMRENIFRRMVRK